MSDPITLDELSNVVLKLTEKIDRLGSSPVDALPGCANGDDEYVMSDEEAAAYEEEQAEIAKQQRADDRMIEEAQRKIKRRLIRTMEANAFAEMRRAERSVRIGRPYEAQLILEDLMNSPEMRFVRDSMGTMRKRRRN